MEPGSWSRTLVSRTKFFFKTKNLGCPRYRTLSRLRREAAVLLGGMGPPAPIPIAKHLDAISSIFLRLVQGLIRPLQEVLHRVRRLRPGRQAQARGDPHLSELTLDQL